MNHMRRSIIFYNPAAPYYTLPLQFLALASVIDRTKYSVHIIDARIEKSTEAAHARLRALLPEALCVGIAVITGTPIRDAVTASRIVKSAYPSVPVVWGGWHPSVLPEQCLREGHADVCVKGQGELTFLDLLDAFSGGGGYDSIEGICYLHEGKFRENPARKFVDVNHFPSYDYSLLPVERYFALKKHRQLDFYSSQGCPYRCSFCADPSVYNRRWSGLRGTRMMTDVFDAVRNFNADEIAFQDDNFFANKSRVQEFCQSYVARGMTFSWTASSRADQIASLSDDYLREMRNANLRRVMIGAESGSQDLLDRMGKDTLVEEALISAANLHRHSISATFGFIVGLPEEGFENTLRTLATVKEIKRINPDFEFNILFYAPYPGTDLFDDIAHKGYRVPQSLAEWSSLDFLKYAGDWLHPLEQEYVRRFKFYTRLGTERRFARPWFYPVKKIAAARLLKNYFQFPVEMHVGNIIRKDILRRHDW
jgi:anaerobic magnesium-protoporphyrin IX monomethyl ester cyclase